MLSQYEHDSQTRIESHPDRPKPGRIKRLLSLNWPSILIVCLIAAHWGIPYLPEKTGRAVGFLTESAPASSPPIIARPSASARAKENIDLKAQLRDANGKIAQLQAKIEAANRELDTARAEKKQHADQLIQFCHTGLLNQLVWFAGWQTLAKEKYAALAGETCYTASCFKNATDIANALTAQTEMLQTTDKKVLDALSLPANEPGCTLQMAQ